MLYEVITPGGTQAAEDQHHLEGKAADAVSGDLKLPRAVLDCGDRVGHGETEIVVAMDADYRAFDTLGEATVLFTVVMGVLAVMRAVGRKEREKADE